MNAADPAAAADPGPDGVEARLRRALAARADRVEPAGTDLAAVEPRTDRVRRADRRRRAVLGAAAALVLVAGLVGAVAIADDDTDRTDLATADRTTETTGGGVDGGPTTVEPSFASPRELATAAPIWPLPTMSVVYTDPAVAALAFAQSYVGLGGQLCTRQAVVEGDVAFVDVAAVDGPAAGGCDGISRSIEPPAPRTTVTLVRTDLTWVVVGADQNSFTTTTSARAVIPTTPTEPPELYPRTATSPLAVSVVWAPESGLAELPPADRRIELRPVGSLDASDRATDVGRQHVDEVGLDASPGPVVLVVTDGTTATVTVIRIDDPALLDAVIWPRPVGAIRFDDPAEAARVFANSYFSSFESPTPPESCARTPGIDGNTATVAIVLDGVCSGGVSSANEPFGPTTTVSLVHTGVTWAVTGATSNRFTVAFGPGELDAGPTPGTPVPIFAFVTPTTDLDEPVELELRRLENGEATAFGSMPSGTEGQRTQIPMAVAFEGRRVLVVHDGTTASATLVDGGATG